MCIFIHSRPDFAIILSQMDGLHSGQNTQWSNLSLSTITSEDFTSHEIAEVISDFKSFCKALASVIKVFHCISLCKSGYAARTKLQYVSCLSSTCNNFLSTSRGSHNFWIKSASERKSGSHKFLRY